MAKKKKNTPLPLKEPTVSMDDDDNNILIEYDVPSINEINEEDEEDDKDDADDEDKEDQEETDIEKDPRQRHLQKGEKEKEERNKGSIVEERKKRSLPATYVQSMPN